MPAARPTPRLLVIGLDCMEPSLLFERWRSELPTLARLMSRGVSGKLESCYPAITVPAWSVMMSGRDPGELGIYGFRNRADASAYQNMVVADSHAVHEPRLWDYLGKAGWKTSVVSVPGTYPPKPVNGSQVSCFLTPNAQADYTYPLSLKEDIHAWVGAEYMFDAEDFRSEDKERIRNDIYTMGEQRFMVASKLLAHDQPDFLMLVDMGVDRMHHAFWSYLDPKHPSYTPNSPYANEIFNYYKFVDSKIADLLAQCSDDTNVLIVSDHGAQAFMGGVCINEWLQQEGYLTLKTQPQKPTSLKEADIDWSKTQAWGMGGYYGRIYLNIQGRDPQGTIAPEDVERVRNELAAKLEAMPGPDGTPLGNKALIPDHMYRATNGFAPDMMAYFGGDMSWRSLGTVGMHTILAKQNDTGVDEANHAQHGIFIFYNPLKPGNGRVLEGAQIYDILPTVLRRYGIQAPSGLRGKVLPW